MLLRYLAKRIIFMLFVFLLISVVVFAIFRAVPGDPVLLHMNPEEMRLPRDMFEAVHAQISQRLGLHRPVHIQYGIWLRNMLSGDFGFSSHHQASVNTVLQGPLLVTLQVNLIVMMVVFLISVPLGIFSAIKKGSVFDNSAQTVTLLGMSLPSFIIAIIAIMTFSVWLNLTPVSGFGDPLFLIHNPDATALQLFRHRLPFMVLPVGVLSFASLAGLTRFVRVAMIDSLSQDYIRTARSKGLGEGSVIWSHAFRNSMIPFVTSLVAWLVGLLTGSIIVEEIFSVQGMGRLFVNSIRTLDFNLAITIQTIFIVLILIGYLLVDFVYVLVDPRVRLS